MGPTNIQGYPVHASDPLPLDSPITQTRGSAGLDLCASTRVVLTPEMGVQPILTLVVSPLPKGAVGLVLGRSSSASKGLNIVLGVIDPDFTGEIKILVSLPRGVAVIAQSDCITQLLVLPSCHDQYPSKNIIRGNKRLGSSGQNMIMLTLDLKDRPLTKLVIEGKRLEGLLDTGAYKSIIKITEWPKAWPLQQVDQTLRGLGITSNPNKSAAILKWKDEEGYNDTVQPYILEHLPVNLWGRAWNRWIYISRLTSHTVIQKLIK